MRTNQEKNIVISMQQEISELHEHIACLNESLLQSVQSLEKYKELNSKNLPSKSNCTEGARLNKPTIQAELDAMVNAFEVAFCFFDKKKRLSFFNTAASQLLNLTTKELYSLSEELWFFEPLSLKNHFDRDEEFGKYYRSFAQLGEVDNNLLIHSVNFFSQVSKEWGVLFCMQKLPEGRT